MAQTQEQHSQHPWKIATFLFYLQKQTKALAQMLTAHHMKHNKIGMQVEASFAIAQRDSLDFLNKNLCKNEITTLVFINSNLYQKKGGDVESAVEEIKTIFIQDYEPYRFIDRNIIRRLLELVGVIHNKQSFVDLLWIVEKITHHHSFHGILSELGVPDILMEMVRKVEGNEELILVVECLKNISLHSAMASELLNLQAIPVLLTIFENEEENDIKEEICSVIVSIFSNTRSISDRDMILCLQTLRKYRLSKSKAINLLTKSIYFHALRQEKKELMTYLIRDENSFITLSKYPNLCLQLLFKLTQNKHNIHDLSHSRFFLQSFEELLRHSRAETRLNALVLLNTLLEKFPILMQSIAYRSSIIERLIQLLSFADEKMKTQCLIFLKILSTSHNTELRTTALLEYHIPFHFITALETAGSSAFLTAVLTQIRRILDFERRIQMKGRKTFTQFFEKQNGRKIVQEIMMTHKQDARLLESAKHLQAQH